MAYPYTVSARPVYEGGFVYLTITLGGNPAGYQGLKSNSLIGTYSSPSTGAISLGSMSIFSPTDSTYLVRYAVPDDALVGSQATVSVHGAITTQFNGDLRIDFDANVIENDSGQFTIDLFDEQAQSVSGDNTRVVANISFAPQRFASSSFDAGRDLIGNVMNSVAGTTAVAALAYQFFTGHIPTLDGFRYLIGADGSNPNGLSTPYYTKFNIENRNINFASNLGIYGEGSDFFKAAYGPLSMHDAIVKAYTEIVGGPDALPTFSAAVVSIERSVPYFQALARERIGGADLSLSAKTAMVGYLLEEVVKADVTNHTYGYLPDLPPIGIYARALENFFLDLSDGTAMGGVSLTGVYGKGTLIDGYNG